MHICLPAFCLCPRSCGIVTKCWLHTWQATLPACLAFWGFQALRIPLPGFLSLSPLTPVLLCLLFFPSISPGWACGALPLRSRMVCESKLLTSGFCRNHQASGCKVFQIVLSYNSCSPPTLSLVNRVLYHQPYRASSHWVECDKNPILLWFKWINIPSVCLFCAWLWGRMDIVKLVIYSAWFSCKTRMHLGCILLVYDECHSAILILFSLLVFIKDAKESKWKLKAPSLYFPPSRHTPNEGLKLDVSCGAYTAYKLSKWCLLKAFVCIQDVPRQSS